MTSQLQRRVRELEIRTGVQYPDVAVSRALREMASASRMVHVLPDWRIIHTWLQAQAYRPAVVAIPFEIRFADETEQLVELDGAEHGKVTLSTLAAKELANKITQLTEDR